MIVDRSSFAGVAFRVVGRLDLLFHSARAALPVASGQHFQWRQ